MLASLVLFTTNALLLKYLASDAEISMWIALAFRAGVGLIIISLFFRHAGGVNLWRAATQKLLVYRGLLGVLGSIAYYFTVPPLGAGKATLISNTYVVIAAVMAVWILKERLTFAKGLGNIVAFSGLVLLVGLTPAEIARFGPYEALAIAGAFLAAGTVVVIRQLTRTETSAMIYASQCVYVLAGSLPPAILVWKTPSPLNFSLLVLAATCATFGQLAMTEGFRHLTVAVGGAFQIMGPVLISMGSVLLFKEPFTSVQVAGAGLILLGCYGAMAFK